MQSSNANSLKGRLPAQSAGDMTMKPKYDVALSGWAFSDLVFTGLSETPQYGAEIFGTGFDMTPGGIFNFVAAAHRQGLQVGWAEISGNDFFSQFIQAECRREGIDTSLFQHVDQARRAVTVSFSNAMERGFISYLESWKKIDLLELIQCTPAHCYFYDGWDDPKLKEIREAANKRQSLLFLDPQYITVSLETPGVIETLRNMDILMPNESEALQLTGVQDVERALDILSQYVPLVVIKCGAKGAIARDRHQKISVPAIHVDAVDTTGAGDVFAAGFLAAYLKGEPLRTCLIHANISGGLSTTARGGTTAAPTLSQVQAYLRTSNIYSDATD